MSGESRFLGVTFLSLSVISVPPTNGQQPTGLVVVLHGFGANAQDLASLAPFLNLSNYQFIFPDAPFPNPYVPGGRMWYEFRGVQGYTNQEYQDLTESQQQLTDMLKSLESSTGVPLSRTVLGGFSQGGAMTLDVGLNLPLAGLVVMSGYLHPFPRQASGTFPPVLIVHGRQDTLVPVSSAQKARDALVDLGVSVQYQEFDMGHEVQPPALVLIRSFIQQVVP